MASGNTLLSVPANGLATPSWLYVAFTSGSIEPAKGDTINGDTSNATAVLELLVLVSGTWGGGDAAGYMMLSNWSGTAWTSGENWTKNTTTAGNDGTLTSTPATAYAQHDIIRGDTPVLAFDASTNEVGLLTSVMPRHYAGGGITVTVGVASSTVTGDMSFGVALKSITDDADVLGTTTVPGPGASGFKAFAEPNYNTAIDAASVVGEVKYFTITFTDGADMDSIAAGEVFQLYLMRDARDSTNDDMAADAWVTFLEIKET